MLERVFTVSQVPSRDLGPASKTLPKMVAVTRSAEALTSVELYGGRLKKLEERNMLRIVVLLKFFVV